MSTANRSRTADASDDAADLALLSPDQVADLLGVPVKRLTAWRSGRRYGPTPVRIGQLVRYRPADVRAWIDSLATDDRPRPDRAVKARAALAAKRAAAKAAAATDAR